MDYSPDDQILFTGDEMGYMQKWDLSLILKKLDEVNRREMKTTYKADAFDDMPGSYKKTSSAA